MGSTVVTSSNRMGSGHVGLVGKFFELNQAKWHVKGVTYGPFARNDNGEFLPNSVQLRRDFDHLYRIGSNCIRLYHVPSRGVLDAAIEAGLRVVVDVPWQKHRCVFDDWPSWEEAHHSVRRAAKELGNHPGLFAISVVNEIPNDIVRFYGSRRVERFIDELIDTAKQECPDCLATFTNYPPTEFLQSARADFCCFNVYLNDTAAFTSYLDRLQHRAGSCPLVLGEYGVDAGWAGQDLQAQMLAKHVGEVYRQGLAGAFVFSYTDDWFTGGYAIDGWGFGITDRQRNEKPATDALRGIWSKIPHLDAAQKPRVSVVVCSYNGAATLEECLASLVKLDYPNYEIVLVDDGSTDNTPEIAARFPTIRCIRQANRGLSVARNVGAEAATGEIVAYTDSDCVADEHWLHYLVSAMRDQHVDAIGGPNITPDSDTWRAQCVAASPGNPGHVMIDDRRAEHVPGCNMAFRRSVLLGIGGFDPQFRQAGDDVDVCWRLLDVGIQIGYASAAVVWHHRRHTVWGYLRQQGGYGDAEGMLRFKHPGRFTSLGCAQWQGVIYGEGAVGLTNMPPPVYHGRFGSALFQIIYPSRQHSVWAYFRLLEWHAIGAFSVLLSMLLPPLALISGVMWSLSLIAAGRAAAGAPLRSSAPWWCRPLVLGLNLAQPIVRSWRRYWYRLVHKRIPPFDDKIVAQLKSISWREGDSYWSSVDGRGRLHLLSELEALAQDSGWSGEFSTEWAAWDATLEGDLWHDIQIRTATEELGMRNRFTRVRCILKPTIWTIACKIAIFVWIAVAIIGWRSWGIYVGMVVAIVMVPMTWLSRRRCFKAIGQLVSLAGQKAGLYPQTNIHFKAVISDAVQPNPCTDMTL